MAKKKSIPTKRTSNQELLDSIMQEIGGTEHGCAQLLGSDGLAIKIKGVISTQVIGIDRAIGRGGIPYGRVTMLRGKEGSGKTTLALHLVAECQCLRGVAIYMDMEYKLDPDYAKGIGVDTANLIISQPNHLEQVYATIEKVVKMAGQHRRESKVNAPILIIVDSMNAAISKAQFTAKSWEDKHVAPQARVHSELLPKLIPILNAENVALVFISQLRGKIGVLYGPKEDTSGGWAPKFYSSLILDVVSIGFDSDGDGDKKDKIKVGSKTIVECVKNQIAPPFRKAVCEIVYGQGFDKNRSLIRVAEELKVMKKKGTWYSFDGKQVAQGMKAAAVEIADDPVLKKRVYKRVKETLGW